MTVDPVLREFEKLGGAIPGSPRAVAEPDPDYESVAAPWDQKPARYMVGGEEKEFFTIRHLATALGRSEVTIRSWENRGLIPRTPYRSPRPRSPQLPGRETRGKRLWTREQILGILRICEEEGVILNGKPPTKRFAAKVTALYKSLVTPN